jgi:hypothetical protein
MSLIRIIIAVFRKLLHPNLYYIDVIGIQRVSKAIETTR